MEERSFVERNAGKLLLCAFLISWPVRALGMLAGEFSVALIADVMFGGFVIFAIAGYVQRRRRRKLAASEENAAEVTDECAG